MKLPSSITLCEVGLRDGLQNEATLLTVHQKVALLLGLIDAGFKVIEVGSFMHPKAVPQMANTDEVYKAIDEIPDVELRALIPNLRGITRAIDCGCKKVKLNVSASRMHNLKNLNMTPEQSVAGFASCVEAARENGIAISGSISMPFASPWEGRTPVEDVDAIIEAYLKVGINEISLSDASGMAVPNQVYDLCSQWDMLCVFHAGLDPVSPDVTRVTPEKAFTIHKKFPKLKMVLAHMGGFARWDEVEELLVGTGIFFDTSLASAHMVPQQALRIIQNHGAERILFGSDCPWGSPEEGARYIDALPLTSEEKDRIFYRNALELLRW